ncbi:CLUMA_CG015172, isoform A [Clunio marinus]|uniref:CLUMA_CG015172, isoform A n=1 Tax=Clunio marinus TaxID=568069 RepID=A0A1J1IPD0_9DIPT|nr:CLUMA_CG015172, isoform A [Clunio marinus]
MCVADMEFDYNKALKRQNLKDSEVEELRKSVKQIENVPKNLSSKRLLCFLSACNGIDDAANVISAYYDIRKACPSIFSNRDTLSPALQQCFANQYYFHLPNTPEGYSVIYHCLSNPKASNYIFDEACKTFFMTIDSLLCTRGPSKGLIIVFDMRNVGLRHLLRPSIESLRMYFRFLQEALPAKLEAMHVVNCVSFFDMVLALIKPCMKSEIIRKIHLHHGTDFTNFHQNFVAKSCLPSDLGGDLESVEELHQQHVLEFERLRNYFIEVNMNVDYKFDYYDAIKRSNLTQSQVDVLRGRVKSLSLVPKTLTNKQLLLFLNHAEGDVDNAVDSLVKHYEIRKKAPQIFTNRDAKLSEIKQCLDNQYFLNLPCTPDGYAVAFHGLSSPIAKRYVYDPSATSFLMMIEALVYKHGPTNGLILLYDMKNFNAGHLLRNKLSSMKKFLAFLQEGIPYKIHSIHIFNTVSFFHLVMAIIKPFMDGDIVKKMHLHSSSLDLEKFTAEHVPRSSLPTEFGGVCDPEVKRKFRKLLAGAFDYEKELRDHNLTQEDVDIFREKLLSCDEVPNALMDKVLVLFLITYKNNIDRSINVIKNYCTIVRSTPEFFGNRDFDSPNVQQTLNNQIYVTLPITPNNCNLILYKVANSDPKNYNFDDSEKTFFMTVEKCIYRNGPRNGVIFLFDMKGARLGHVFRPSFSSLRKIMKLVQDSCPFRIVNIHVLNTTTIVDVIMAMLKPLIRSNLLERVIFHPVNLDYNKFYEEWIPKSCLPSDYGGDLPTIEEMHNSQRDSLLEMRDYFLMEERILNFEFEDYDFDKPDSDDMSSLVSKFKQIIESAYNYKEALEREQIKQENVKALREKVKTFECVPKLIADNQLILFLNACKSDVDKSAKLIHNYYQIKQTSPEFFANRDVESEEIQNCLNNQDYVALPLTPDNCHLIFHRLSNNDPSKYNFDSAAKTFIMLTESSFFHNGPRSGIVFLFDLQGVGFMHLFKPSISSMRKGIRLVEEGMPIQMKAVHVLNSGMVFKMILELDVRHSSEETMAELANRLIEDAYDYEEALKRQNLRHEDVERLREKIKESKYVPTDMFDKQLLLFLNAFQGNVDKSAEMLNNYYKLKKTSPEFFKNRDLQNREIQESLDHQDYVALPITPDNCILIFHRLSSFKPKHYVFDDAVKTFIVTSEAYAYRHGPRSGTIFVFDLTGASLSHLRQPAISSLRKGIRFLEDGNPFDIKAIHILNSVSFFNSIIALVKPFIRSEILSKLHFHSSNMDYEKFYQECIPKSHLPSDFGGDLESVEVLHKKHREELMELRDYFIFEENQQLTSPKNLMKKSSKKDANANEIDRWLIKMAAAVQVFQDIQRNAYNYNDALKRINMTRDDIERYREKLKLKEAVPKFLVDTQLLVFLNCGEGDYDKAADKLENYYVIKRTLPEFFVNRDVRDKKIQHCFDSVYFVGLPVTPDDNYVILQKLRSTDPKDYNFEDSVKTYIMKTEEYAYRNGPRSGTVFVNDLTGASFRHIFRVSMSSIFKGMKFLQEGSPLNVKAIHILNCPPFLNVIISMVKPFIWAEMMSKIHFHSSNMDFEEFYEKHIPKSCLPSDYGGDLESVEVLHNRQRKEFIDMRNYFLMEEKQVNFEGDQYAEAYEEYRKDPMFLFLSYFKLLLFLINTNCDIEKSSKWLHHYYKMKRNTPEFFFNRDVLSDDIQRAFENQIYFYLPVTPNNCHAVFHKLSNHEPKLYEFNTTVKTFIMTAEACLFRYGPRDGTIFIYDMEGCKFGHLFQASIRSVKKGLEFLQYGSPMNIKSIIILNAPYFMDVVFSMIKPFLKKEFIERIHLVHDMEHFYNNIIPRSHMPSDYGGELKSQSIKTDAMDDDQKFEELRKVYQKTVDELMEKAFDLKTALKTINRSENELKELRDLVESEKWIPRCVTEKHLAVFLANDGDVKDCFERVKLIFKLKLQSPEVFRYRDPCSDEMARTFMYQNMFYLPVTPDGYSVCFGNLRNTEVQNFHFDSIAKAFYMTIESTFLRQGPQKGIIFLVDMAGGKLWHLSRINIKTMKTSLKFAMDAAPEKIIAFHVLNAVPFYDLIMKIMKPFARKELKLLVLHLHYADIDWENFYETVIPRSCLPSNYGGELESVEELSRKNLEQLKELKDYFMIEEWCVYEDRRENSTKQTLHNMDFDLEYDYMEALKRQGHVQADVDALRNIVESYSIVPKSITNKQILLFLDSCGGIEEGARVMKIYYQIKKNSPEHFLNRDPQNPKIQQCLKHQDYFYLPNTPKGDLIIFHRLSSPKASDYCFDEAIKTFFMTIESCLQLHGPRDGAIFLFDMKGVGLMHLTRVNLTSIKKFFAYLQEGVPGKLRAIHVLNVVYFFDKILSMIKPFMKAEILKCLHLHSSGMDYGKFYKEHIPKSCLPSDFGGDLESVAELHAKHCKEFMRLRSYFMIEEQQAAFKLDMHQPFLASASAQLNYMTTEELREIFSNDDKLDETINEILKSLENEKDVIINENRTLAESNLEMEPKLIEIRSRINDLTQEGKDLSQSVQSKLEEIKSKSSNVNPENMLDILKASAAESEEKSEKFAEDFLESSASIEEFLDKFKESRIEMHLRKLKADKMQELLRRGNTGNGPPAQSNYPPGPGNFYGQHQRNPAPYPNMPSYPMMPMPPVYRPPF